MFTGIDHVAIVVNELESAIESYSRAGFTVVRGGKHPIGTHNALIAFADGSYFELIAFVKPNTGHPGKRRSRRAAASSTFAWRLTILRRTSSRCAARAQKSATRFR